MPLRPEFEKAVTNAQKTTAKKSFGFDPAQPVVVVTGGSLGARRINDTISAVVPLFERAGIQILHLRGRQKAGQSARATAPIEPRPARAGYIALEYCDRMRDALAAADLVVSRAGASTVCEIAALGIPAVFVPYPVGNGEQRFNAQPLVIAEAALLVADAEFTSDWVVENLLPLVRDTTRLRHMARASRANGIRDGAERMCALIDEARAEIPSTRTLS
jgi:UDP-N-acetylglucosamine--N-acetylmuramyl-(pentapeptide) pyrophosphoryl-undecaprenol N-acetylglucosamine transferase